MRTAAEVLALVAEGWFDLNGERFPESRTIDQLRADPQFREQASDAVVAAVPLRVEAEAVR